MPLHSEQKTLPFTPHQLFDLVADVERYPEFLPWCLDCRITKRETDHTFLADLIIGYKFIREKFGSRVTLNRTGTPPPNGNPSAIWGPESNQRWTPDCAGVTTLASSENDIPTIRVEYISGPMRYLSNNWRFIDNHDGTTTIHFDIDFEFKNALLQGLMGLFFHEAVRRMVTAFEARAQAVYDPQ